MWHDVIKGHPIKVSPLTQPAGEWEHHTRQLWSPGNGDTSELYNKRVTALNLR